MTYRLTVSPDHILRDEDGAVIPVDPANRDYVAFLAWIEEGNEPIPYEPPISPEQQKVTSKTESNSGSN